jgi:hypothetical protein
MARNRKSQSAAIRFGPALKAVLLCLLIGGSGLGYVWQKDQILRLSQQYKAKERQLQLLVEQNAKLRQLLATWRSPLELQKRAPKLGMFPTPASQFWVLPEPSAEPPKATPAPQAQYVAQAVRPPGR